MSTKKELIKQVTKLQADIVNLEKENKRLIEVAAKSKHPEIISISDKEYYKLEHESIYGHIRLIHIDRDDTRCIYLDYKILPQLFHSITKLLIKEIEKLNDELHAEGHKIAEMHKVKTALQTLTTFKEK